ncbi:MAG: hypothetical protein WBO68_07745 [Pyrinomonadaceae bacterium]
MKSLRTISILLLLYSASFALPGDLDTTFGVSGGYVVSDFLVAQVDEIANDVAVQTDGKIVIVGSRYAGINALDYLVARYNADGTLDTTFSGDGIFLLHNSNSDNLNAVAIQTDGKIVAVGQSNSSSEAYAIRLNTNGTLDTTFSGDGLFEITSAGIALSVALQTDGKIVIGSRGLSGESIIIRLTTTGGLDTTFDTDGLVSLSPSHFEPYGLAIQSNGRIVVAGSSSIFAGGDISTVRLLTTGALDPTFDSDGIAVTAVYAGDSEARSLAIQTDGKILVGGGPGANGSETEAALVRYNSNGSLDTTFDGDGIKTFNLNIGSGDKYFNDLAAQADGKILAIGDTTYSILSLFVIEDFTILRLNADGSFDTSFDGNGIVRSQWCEQGSDLALQTDGKIVAIGWQERPSSPNDSGICTQRFNDNGAVDTSLNFSAGDGTMKQTVLSAQEFSSVEAIAAQLNGKIYVAGWGEVANQSYNIAKLIRLNADGTLDTTFMDEGVYEYSNGSTSTYFNDLKVLSDGSLFVAGEGGIPLGGVIAKFTPSGAPDTTFSVDGVTNVSAISRIYGLTVQPDGKIIGCGSNGSGLAPRNGKIVRLSATGTLETDIFSNFGNANNNEIFECSLQSDGKLIVAGYGNDGTSDFVGISRKLTTLATDTAFGTSGIVTNDLSAALNDRATDLIVQPDNKIVVTSTGLNMGGDRDFAILRYDPNGALDPNFTENFGTNGISLIDFVIGNPNDDANALLFQPDGQMIAGGLSDNAVDKRFGVAKLNANGTPALGFGTLGRIATTFPNNDARINALGFYLTDRIVAAGKTWNGTDYDLAVVRYQNELIPTSANVSVSGRISSAAGNGIKNVIVTLVSPNGSVLTSRTSTFGYFRFDEIAVGETYVISVNSKRYTFDPSSQILSVNEELTNIDFVAQE